MTPVSLFLAAPPYFFQVTPHLNPLLFWPPLLLSPPSICAKTFYFFMFSAGFRSSRAVFSCVYAHFASSLLSHGAWFFFFFFTSSSTSRPFPRSFFFLRLLRVFFPTISAPPCASARGGRFFGASYGAPDAWGLFFFFFWW